MRRYVIATMIIVLAAVPALAQQQGRATSRTEEQKRTDAEIDQAYKRVIRSTGEKGRPAPADPWGKVRSSPGSADKR